MLKDFIKNEQNIKEENKKIETIENQFSNTFEIFLGVTLLPLLIFVLFSIHSDFFDFLSIIQENINDLFMIENDTSALSYFINQLDSQLIFMENKEIFIDKSFFSATESYFQIMNISSLDYFKKNLDTLNISTLFPFLSIILVLFMRGLKHFICIFKIGDHNGFKPLRIVVYLLLMMALTASVFTTENMNIFSSMSILDSINTTIYFLFFYSLIRFIISVYFTFKIGFFSNSLLNKTKKNKDSLLKENKAKQKEIFESESVMRQLLVDFESDNNSRFEEDVMGDLIADFEETKRRKIKKQEKVGNAEKIVNQYFNNEAEKKNEIKIQND